MIGELGLSKWAVGRGIGTLLLQIYWHLNTGKALGLFLDVIEHNALPSLCTLNMDSPSDAFWLLRVQKQDKLSAHGSRWNVHSLSSSDDIVIHILFPSIAIWSTRLSWQNAREFNREFSASLCLRCIARCEMEMETV